MNIVSVKQHLLKDTIFFTIYSFVFNYLVLFLFFLFHNVTLFMKLVNIYLKKLYNVTNLRNVNLLFSN